MSLSWLHMAVKNGMSYQQLLYLPEDYQMREVASLSLISGHNNSHPGTILTKERCPMVLHPPLAWRVVRSISSYLGMR